MSKHSAAARLVLVLLCEAGVYAVICAALARVDDLPVLALLALWVALYFCTRLVLVLATFAFAWWSQRPWNLTVRGWITMVSAEFMALLRVEWLILSEAWRGESSGVSERNDSLPLIIFLHGIYCNRGVWRPVMRKLQYAGCVMRALSLAPVTADLATQTRSLAAWLESNPGRNSRQRVIVVAHSLGGLIARGCLPHASINALICIGTPHAGSRVANALHSAIGKDLQPHSSAIDALAARRNGTGPITCLYSPQDNLVVPAGSATLAGLPRASVAATGHLALIYSPVVLDAIRQAIAHAAVQRSAIVTEPA
ncbi:MAG: alpha/beta fold hydrolase [Steroidobacteraceae bacterium]